MGFRLSPQQELLFASGAVDPGFRAQCAVRVDGVDPAQLGEALTSIVNRHEILRTLFVRSAGMQLPSQVIQDRLDPDWQLDENWDEQAVSVETVLAEEARFPFDPARGPLLRARLLSSPTGAQALLLTAPSVIADAASLVEIVRELRSQDAGDDEPLQYADYAEWRNEAAGRSASLRNRMAMRPRRRPCSSVGARRGARRRAKRAWSCRSPLSSPRHSRLRHATRGGADGPRGRGVLARLRAPPVRCRNGGRRVGERLGA